MRGGGGDIPKGEGRREGEIPSDLALGAGPDHGGGEIPGTPGKANQRRWAATIEAKIIKRNRKQLRTSRVS